ncbi:MAG: hypothetical protein K0R49_1410 [Burkholderiales bacterium]|jgi:hypothetical protein|nr:hypothetical protein [Burkholderiales bacterium]
MIDFIKGMGTFLKKDKPSAGTQRISELVNEAIYLSEKDEIAADAVRDVEKNIEDDYFSSQQIIQHEQELNNIEKPSTQQIMEFNANRFENNDIDSDKVILEKITSEIFLNQDFINNLCVKIANILTIKIINTQNIINDGQYKDRTNKFLETLEPIILAELENFSQEYLLGKSG